MLEVLKSTPIMELNFGDVRLRRKITRAGFKNICDLLTLSDSEIDERFEWNDADAIISLKERYECNPEGFARSVLKKDPSANPTPTKIPRVDAVDEARRRIESEKRENARTGSTWAYSDGPSTLPPFPFSEKLKGFEARARAELDRLADQYEDVLAYLAFDEFATELDEVDEAFRSLFEHYKNQPRYAISLIDRFLRNIFLVYTADRARKEYDGGNLWGNLFDGLGMKDGNAQGAFKRVFVRQIERRRMPLYAADEEANYYFYTALLHGGLSADSWESLWVKSLMPLAREIAKGDYGFGGEMDGRSILKEIKDPASRFAPKKSVLNILGKAPDFTIAPLFEASLRVASQVESAGKSGSGLTMLTSYGLPDIAMQALRAGGEKQPGTRKSTRAANSARGKDDPRMLYLPEARLQLDLAQGLVFLRWGKQQFSSDFIRSRMDYYMDGVLMFSQSFKASVGKCVLDAVEISVKPQVRYDIELRLMEETDDGEWEERGSLEQTFSRSKPECFEFIRDTHGLYRLRGKNERITRPRQVAYIIKKGYGVEPDQGMTLVAEYGTAETWGAARIFVYDVEPGASGSVIDLITREEVAVWQERYSARVDKRRIIGETAGGLDLYGFVPCGLGTNGGLPSVSIEAADGMTALNDLDIRCFCDGQRVSVPRHVLWEDELGDSSAARIALTPSESSLFDWHINLCELEARQRSAGGKAVFRYRFAVIPIQDFKLSSAEIEFGTTVADYQFQARLPLRVTDLQGRESEVAAWGRYSARTLLRDEFLDLRIETVAEGKSTDVKLGLAAIDVELPKRLREISQERPICLADALEFGPAGGNVIIRAFGYRYNRAAVSFMGEIPLFFKELRRPGAHVFNVFRDEGNFLQGNDTAPRNKPLRLSICYGDDISEGYRKPAWTDMGLLSCREGFGFSSWGVITRSDGTHAIVLDAPTLYGVRLDFKRKVEGMLVGSVDILEGATEAVLPQAVVRQLDIRKKLVMIIVPTDWQGEPDYRYASKFELNR